MHPERSPVPILMYHSISAEATRHFRPFTVAPERFRQQLAYLSAAGYTSLTISQLSELRRTAAPLPSRPVLLTFDDGYADFYDVALPLLLDHGFTATLYVVSEYVGGTSRWLVREGETERPLLCWSQLRTIAAAGIECGAHGHTHAQLDLLASAAVFADVARCRAVLEDQLAAPVRSFAYPFGYYRRATVDAVAAAGFACACAVGYRLSRPTDDPLLLQRVMVAADTDLAAFARLLRRGNGVARPLAVAGTRPLWRAVRRRHGDPK